jgi:cellulose synthase/poly-beta-1,6-N-acetylglucosamine synthase-like glycosyltransferase
MIWASWIFYLGLAGVTLFHARFVHWLWLRTRKLAPSETAVAAILGTNSLPADRAYLPRILIQIPLFNEGDVIRPLLQALQEQEYPRDLYAVQVLDDSNDSYSLQIVDEEIANLKKKSIDARFLRRADRRGFKAGACQEGLEQIDANKEFPRFEIVAILDADFQPGGSFLGEIADHLTEEKTAFVQFGWSYKNAGLSWLTRAQALSLDAHFFVEQKARSEAGTFFNFNGTAGAWRIDLIRELGGWNGNLLTEDMDLSIRAMNEGYLGKFVEYSVPSLLPQSMQALKVQQHRWTAGTLQNARLHLGRVLINPSVKWPQKLDVVFTLLAPFSWFFSLLVLLGFAPYTIFHVLNSSHFDLTEKIGLTLALIFNFGSMFIYYRQARKQLGWFSFVREFLQLLLLSIALTPSNSLAVVSGLFRKSALFVRTPKSSRFLAQRARWSVRILEGSLLCLVGATLFVQGRDALPLTIPFGLLFFAGIGAAIGFDYVKPRIERK